MENKELLHASLRGREMAGHKYISRYQGRNGKWLYVYDTPKSKRISSGNVNQNNQPNPNMLMYNNQSIVNRQSNLHREALSNIGKNTSEKVLNRNNKGESQNKNASSDRTMTTKENTNSPAKNLNTTPESKLYSKISGYTGMKESEIAKVHKIGQEKGYKSDEFLNAIFGIAEGDPEQVHRILDDLFDFNEQKTGMRHSSLDDKELYHYGLKPMKW